MGSDVGYIVGLFEVGTNVVGSLLGRFVCPAIVGVTDDGTVVG